MTKPYRLKTEHGKYVYLLSLDGSNTDLFYGMLDAGEMPNIQKYFFDNMIVGTKTGLCGLPSVTTYSHDMYTTGRISRHPGLRWLNRKAQEGTDRIVDYGKNFGVDRLEEDACLEGNTLFEIIGDGVAMLEFTNRGAKHKYRKRFWIGAMWSALFSMFKHWRMNRNVLSMYPTDKITNYSLAVDEMTTRKIIKTYKKGCPRLLIDWKWGMDEVAHSHGVSDGVLEYTYSRIDAQVGRTMEAIKNTGNFDDFLFVMLADHNNLPVNENMCLDDMLNGYGFDTKEKIHDMKYDVRATYFGDATGYVYYLKRKGDPDKRVTIVDEDLLKLVDNLCAEPSTSIVLARGNDRNDYGDRDHELILASRNGKARVQTKMEEGVKKYRLHPESDNVLRYKDDIFNAIIRWHTSEDNLRLTSNEAIPWVLPSVEKVFSDKRSPDVMTIAADGYDYSGGNATGDNILQKLIGHTCLKTADGLASKAGRTVPIVFSGDPTRFRQSGGLYVPTGTLVDVPPTIIDLLAPDELERYRFDGISLLKRDYSMYVEDEEIK
ncbi:hypothetical protein COV93_00670 [Candidatus Woesearchaeota archaeon CG11_big_fil_rev_8_21_14_0_20_43_8]|nr:MAG: hypothetical protein COV93_00670 [Candidatus Woesearchaeota archaeon CG11_big_fil_rev_8_21_14_0_20_43_8]PIO06797.1 MAG: hypothetical protein COT47_02705 [Candidatus Woesearchaeota archaeon CG08_land_8_20_14_0_20_43_7]